MANRKLGPSTRDRLIVLAAARLSQPEPSDEQVEQAIGAAAKAIQGLVYVHWLTSSPESREMLVRAVRRYSKRTGGRQREPGA